MLPVSQAYFLVVYAIAWEGDTRSQEIRLSSIYAYAILLSMSLNKALQVQHYSLKLISSGCTWSVVAAHAQ